MGSKEQFRIELPGALHIALYKHDDDTFYSLEIDDGGCSGCMLAMSRDELRELALGILRAIITAPAINEEPQLGWYDMQSLINILSEIQSYLD